MCGVTVICMKLTVPPNVPLTNKTKIQTFQLMTTVSDNLYSDHSNTVAMQIYVNALLGELI